MVKNSGYKLFSAAPGDGPKVCAFFLSEAGCRSGAECKFSHDPEVAAAAAITAKRMKTEESSDPFLSSPASNHVSSNCSSSSSVVSSESEGEIAEVNAGASVSFKEQDDSAPVGSYAALANLPQSKPDEVDTDMEDKEQNQVTTEDGSEKKSKKRKQNPCESGDIFVNPYETEVSTPVRKEVAEPCTNTPPNATKSKAEGQPHIEASPLPSVVKHNQPPAVNAAVTPTTDRIASFRDLNLPIAAFSLPPISGTPNQDTDAMSPKREASPPPPPRPLPKATPLHVKWQKTVIATRKERAYANTFNFERARQSEFESGLSTPADWIEARPYGEWCKSNPASIAIDCEMCETRCPKTRTVDSSALCRLSVVNADNPDEVLIDTLVKPRWPVTDYRSRINGIKKKDLESVQFTMEHCQAFMMALCSDETVVVGHAVHNDLFSMRMVHHCNADTALLYHVDEDNRGTPSLKDLAYAVLDGTIMPDVHDSVNDARQALFCAEKYVEKDGKVDLIPRKFRKIRNSSSGGNRRNSSSGGDRRNSSGGDGKGTDGYFQKLLVHRLPRAVQSQHIAKMFMAHTGVEPANVPEIEFSGKSGKCKVEFKTSKHAQLAYTSLTGDEREDKAGFKQKRVFLRDGAYVYVRKMNMDKTDDPK